jgi:D-alanyl-D-alanine carboxypeptidase
VFARHLLALVLVPLSLSAQAMPTPAAAKRVVDSLARDFIARNQAPSVAIAVLRGNDTISIAAFGMANLELEVPATPQTVYRIGSVTKQFTSAMVMQLIEQNKVNLEDSIGAHLSGLPAPWRPVTIHQLLNHTSGIPSYTGLGEVWRRRWAEEMTPDTIIAMVRDKPMDFPRGTQWAYNNTGYILLGMLIEKVTGKTWGEELVSRFAGPLELKDTRNCPTTPLIPRRASGYEEENGVWGNTPFLAMTQPYSAGAMCSTVGDLARWNRALHTGKVVSTASYDLMITPTGAANVRPLYGFGLMRDTIAGRDLIVHGGGIHGFVTANSWLPSAGLSVSVLTNGGANSPQDLMKQLIRASIGAPLEGPPAVPMASPLTPELRDLYQGVYALALPIGIRDFTVAAAGDQLTGQLVGQAPNAMIYLGNHTFGADFDKALRIVFTVENGRSIKMTLMQGGQSFDGARKP